MPATSCGAGQVWGGRSPAQGEGGAHFLKAAPAGITESALPLTVTRRIFHFTSLYLPTYMSSEAGGF